MIVYAAPDHIVKPDLSSFFGPGVHDSQAYSKAENDYIDAIGQYAVEQSEPHALVGAYVAVPYADGSAQYVVCKFQGRVGLIHLDLMDGWRDGRFERLATVAELKRIVETRRKRAEFFAARETERTSSS